MDTTCRRCGRLVPPGQMESQYDEYAAILARQLEPGMPDDLPRNVASATEAWRCSRCERWICNDCILPIILASRARKMRHKRCGGVFLAPDAPNWIGTRGQRAVRPGSWRARFGIEAS